MTFSPVLPAAVLVLVAVVVVVCRALVLRRALTQVRPGHYAPVVLRWSGLTLAVLLLVIAAARPSVSTSAPSSERSPASDLNVYFVVDRSPASRVEDFGDGRTRMAGIRQDITALVDQYPGARFAVISFSSSSDLDWPLSEDVWSLRPMIASMPAYPSTSPDALFDVNAAAGNDILRYELEQAAEQFPGSKNLVFYFGSGADGSRVPQGSFDVADESVSGGAVFGYGTPAGGQVPSELVNGQVAYAVDAGSGAPLRSALNDPALRTIADQLGLPYVHRESGQSIGDALSGSGDGASASRGTGRVELYWVFSLVAAALILVEIYLNVREYRRNRVVRQEVWQ